MKYWLTVSSLEMSSTHKLLGWEKLKAKATAAHSCPSASVRGQYLCRTTNWVVNLWGRGEYLQQKTRTATEKSHNSFTCCSGKNPSV